MNDNINSSPASEASPVGKVSARRRLIRGAFAAPAVLALHTGSAMATSSPLRCVASTAGSTGAVPITTARDTPVGGIVWYRIELYMNAAGTVFYVHGTDIPADLRGPATIPAHGAYHQFNTTTNVMSAAPEASPPSVIRATRFVALRIDGSGKVVSVGGTAGTPFTQSCWTSFLASP